MTDIFKPISDGNSPPPSPTDPFQSTGNEPARTLIAGVVGGLVSAAGYLIYSRLPEDQKERIHQQVRTVVESRVNELRSRFNI
jgi:hypothetical protein